MLIFISSKTLRFWGVNYYGNGGKHGLVNVQMNVHGFVNGGYGHYINYTNYIYKILKVETIKNNR